MRPSGSRRSSRGPRGRRRGQRARRACAGCGRGRRARCDRSGRARATPTGASRPSRDPAGSPRLLLEIGEPLEHLTALGVAPRGEQGLRELTRRLASDLRILVAHRQEAQVDADRERVVTQHAARERRGATQERHGELGVALAIAERDEHGHELARAALVALRGGLRGVDERALAGLRHDRREARVVGAHRVVHLGLEHELELLELVSTVGRGELGLE